MESLSDVMWKMFGGYLEVLEKFWEKIIKYELLCVGLDEKMRKYFLYIFFLNFKFKIKRTKN
jgi:hypothetical protein